MKNSIQKPFFATVAMVLLVNCSALEKGVVISKEIEPAQNKKSVKYIGKVMVPSNTFIESKYLIAVKGDGKTSSFEIDSLNYSQIQVNDSISFDRNRIVKYW